MKLELDAPIPPALFAAVAEILAHLFAEDARLSRRAATSSPIQPSSGPQGAPLR
ncbi:hypothetical protein SAMN07250955_106265 [Arboricoccus pini]|uniref:Uncharacterized protein n=1 Tax=Arboricoccus pini TaxID=1963835 RepID=A0A212R9P6_9PROT|nr:EscU/YscU/HrcU family type III secretion system export apparatus switch protein [Arboricoccus pini]SNB68917.1 hypothetical protein SAMN07250955_106265 [Arboricoccus pini]